MIALGGAALVVPAAPVAAAPSPVSIVSVSAENVKPGDKVRVRFRVTNTGSRADTAIVVVGGGLACIAGCRAEPNLKGGQSQDFQATVVAPQVGPGETLGLNISVGVRLGGQNSYAFKMVSISGAGAPQPEAAKPPSGVVAVTGRVRDGSGKALAGAALTVRDSAGHEYRTTSDRSGRFSVKAGAGRTIAKGRITVVASLDGYRTARATVQGSAGETATVRLTLAAVATPATTSPSPTATAAVDEAPVPETVASSEAPLALKTVSDEGSGPLPFVLGGLLVAAGLGALALLVVRRRRTPDIPAPHPAAQGGAGVIDAPTAVLHMGPPTGRFPGAYGASSPGGHDPHGRPAR